VDLVDVFRDARHLPGHVDEILSLDPLPRAVWLQRGIRDDDSAARLCDAGIDVVQDRCLMVEHARLLGAAGVGVATAPQPELLRVRVRVDYDFASSLCYVAHRCMERLKAPLEELGIRLDWSPLDLTRITGWRRGAEMDEIRRANVRRVARELCVPLVIPRTWQDWRRAHAVALLAPPEREATWRERVWSAVYEEGRELAADALAAELGLALSDEALTAGLERLEERTRSAAEQEVTGVPNFMLGAWPFGGIQTDETMLSILGRFASKHREGAQA
jgi:predicted DsbA family dithiol-disulfide isomerase